MGIDNTEPGQILDKHFQQINYENREILAFLKKSRLFGSFKEDLLEKLIPLSTFCQYPKGAMILEEGKRNEKLYFLIKGSVDVTIQEEAIMTLRRVGDLFGEMSIIDNNPSQVSIRASEEKTEVFTIDATNVGNYTDMTPLEIQNFMYRIFAKVLSEKLNLTTHKARQFEKTNLALQTAKLSLQEDITQRQKIEDELRVANQAKDRFLSNISHELRTPMHHILNFSQFGIRKFGIAPREKLLHYFRQIRKTGDNLMGLLNNLLDLSCLESGKVIYDIEEYSIKGILENSIQKLKDQADEKEVTVNLNVPGFDTMVPCDEARIRKMVFNLLSNAIKYTGNRTSISVSFDIDEIHHQCSRVPALKVQIRDQGVGVPESELGLIFDKFVQSSRTNDGAGGAGLGLSICNEIIKAHHGKLWVENNKEGGATFNFLLPYLNLTPN